MMVIIRLLHRKEKLSRSILEKYGFSSHIYCHSVLKPVYERNEARIINLVINCNFHCLKTEKWEGLLLFSVLPQT